MAEIVEQRRIWFASVLSQDDIFEGRPLFEWESPAWTRRGIRELILRRNPGLRIVLREQLVNRFIARLRAPTQLALMKAQLEQALTRTYGQSSIASFFTSAVTQRDWADYASRGSGYGVVFDFTKPWSYESALGMTNEKMVPFPIYYVDPASRPRIKLSFRGFDPAAGFEDVRKGLLMKSEEWASQKEERLFRIGIPAGYVEFPSSSLAGLVLGYDASSALSEEAIGLGLRARIPVVRASRGLGYQLDLSPA